MGTKITSKIVKSIALPKANSNKYQNGRLLIIAGSKKYHGALLFALKTASRLVGLIYVLSTDDNQKLVKKLKSQTAEFITTDEFPKPSYYDCVLIGPGLEPNRRTQALVKKALLSGKKAVLDAGALRALDGKLKKLLNPGHILTPHFGEFRGVFKLKPTAANAAKISNKFNCTVVLKGHQPAVATPAGKIFYNTTGNAGMAKGGSGDVLAGLIAGLFCKNSARISSSAGLYLNGKAGDDLHKKVGTFYDSEDLGKQIPKTLKHLFG